MYMQKYRILIADDHSMLREALVSFINATGSFHVVTATGNGKELVASLAAGIEADLALIDLSMPEMDGYATAQWLQQYRPGIKIIVLTMFDPGFPLLRLMQLGIRGFLKKDADPSELRMALDAVAEDGYYYTSGTACRLAAILEKQDPDDTSSFRPWLSKSEIEFLKLASTEFTYKEIASRMGITPRAVDGYRDGLFEKLGVKNRVGLVIYAVKNGIVCF